MKCVTGSQDSGNLAKMVMILLTHRNLSAEDQAALLGIASREPLINS